MLPVFDISCECSFLIIRTVVTFYKDTHDGRPRYVERNKKQGKAYERVVPAEIVFCKEIGAWALRHDDIKTSSDGASEVNQYMLSYCRFQFPSC